MIDVEIKTTERTIQEKINDWKELKDLLLKYENYISISCSNNTRKETDDEKRHTR